MLQFRPQKKDSSLQQLLEKQKGKETLAETEKLLKTLEERGHELQDGDLRNKTFSTKIAAMVVSRVAKTNEQPNQIHQSENQTCAPDNTFYDSTTSLPSSTVDPSVKHVDSIHETKNPSEGYGSKKCQGDNNDRALSSQSDELATVMATKNMVKDAKDGEHDSSITPVQDEDYSKNVQETDKNHEAHGNVGIHENENMIESEHTEVNGESRNLECTKDTKKEVYKPVDIFDDTQTCRETLKESNSNQAQKDVPFDDNMLDDSFKEIFPPDVKFVSYPGADKAYSESKAVLIEYKMSST